MTPFKRPCGKEKYQNMDNTKMKKKKKQKNEGDLQMKDTYKCPKASMKHSDNH